MVTQTFRPSSKAVENAAAHTCSAQPSWFAPDASRAYYERLSLIWAPLSMFILLVVILGTPIYKSCDRNAYLLISLVGCLPGFLIPVLFPCEEDRKRPFCERFWVKGTVWISVFGFYGNYFWTHYFYQLLGAKYLFDSHRVNDVPIVCFTCTFFYFTFYFNFASLLLRRLAFTTRHSPLYLRTILWWLNIFVLSYATAVFEAVSIQHFPLYTFDDRYSFVTIGSVFYGLYFVVGFPMFLALDETRVKGELRSYTLWEVVVNACGASAIVTVLLDFWRLAIGSLEQIGKAAHYPLPFVYQSDVSSVLHTSL